MKKHLYLDLLSCNIGVVLYTFYAYLYNSFIVFRIFSLKNEAPSFERTLTNVETVY